MEKQVLQRVSTDPGSYIDFRPVPINGSTSIRDNRNPVSIAIDERKFLLEKHFGLITSIDNGIQTRTGFRKSQSRTTEKRRKPSMT
jgi:hypothetical protein